MTTGGQEASGCQPQLGFTVRTHQGHPLTAFVLVSQLSSRRFRLVTMKKQQGSAKRVAIVGAV